MNKLKLTFLQDVRPERFFIVVAALFGLFFLIATPPFQTPDEPVHFYRAYQISEGNLEIDHISKPGVNGGYLPISLAKTVDLTTQSHGIEFQPNVKYNLHATKAALSITTEPTKKQIYEMSTTSSYSAIAYIPQSLGVLAARILHMPPLLMMYAGRFMNLVSWIILFVIAIRLMPYKKWALVAIGLLPMAVFQATSLGIDVSVIGLSAVVLALILRLRAVTPPFSIKKLALLGALITALVLTKPIMFVFIPLVLLLPKEGFRSAKHNWLIKLSLCGFPLLFFVIWSVATKDLSVSSVPSNFNPQPTSQLRFIVFHPLAYLEVIWKTYFFTNSDGIARSFIGNFGWVDGPLSEFFATLGYGILAFLMLASSNATLSDRLVKREKLIIGAVIIAYWIAVTTALYVYFSPLQYKSVIGIQGRYFTPMAIMLIPLLRGTWLRVSGLHYRRAAMYAPVFMLFVSAITIYYRYYVHA